MLVAVGGRAKDRMEGRDFAAKALNKNRALQDLLTQKIRRDTLGS